MRRLIFVACAFSAVLSLPLRAREDSCLRRTLAVDVKDAKGFPVRGMTEKDFIAKVSGDSVKILSIVPDDRPHRIVILIDASGSMANAWRQSLAPASAFTEFQLQNAQIALIVFGEKIYEQIPFTKGQKAVADRLRQIRSGATYPAPLFHGRTALYDSLLAGMDLLGNPTSADSLYLISDGGDNASRTKGDDVTNRLTSNGVRLFVSLVVADHHLDNHLSPEEHDGPKTLYEMVKKTGGEMIQPFTEGDLPNKLNEAEKIANAMDAFHRKMIYSFRLELELSKPLNKWRSWELKSSGDNKEKWKDVRLVYPSQLAACSK